MRPRSYTQIRYGLGCSSLLRSATRMAKRMRGRPPILVLAVLLAACGPGRAIDGSGNNPIDPTIGAANTTLARLAAPAYTDGISSLAGADRPNPRLISTIVVAQTQPAPNPAAASDFVWQWGQFIDHDLDLTDSGTEPADIPVPAGDPFFDPYGSGTQVIGFVRSLAVPGTGTDPGNPREQPNALTAWIDASQVYGSDPVRAAALRTNDGTGRLATSAGDLLPFNVTGLPNAGGTHPSFFLAGDVRANEQVGLAAMHTLFVREHNTIAALIRDRFPNWSGDRIYESARAIVGAEIQAITYNEFLPIILGPDALAPYTHYDPHVDASIVNSFSTAAFRFGHSMLSTTLLRLDASGAPIAAGNLPLRDAFFAPHRITDEGGIEPLLRGLASQVAQNIDPFIVDEVRNFLFGPPGAGGFDLAALNIQRGRDHGLPSYNDMRVALGLSPATCFADISSDPGIQARLAAAYGDVNRVDLWVGGMAEDHVPGAMLGEVFFTILKQQFEALRDGDRFWYERSFSAPYRQLIASTRLSDIIRRNTEIADEIADDVFHVY